jgi:hypothetical protein
VDQYLFVITRDLSADPSAAHLVRIAGATARRKHEVTVVLAESAIGRDSREACRSVLERLRSAGARLLIHVELLQEAELSAEELTLCVADDQSLASLLLTPGMRAHWC